MLTSDKKPQSCTVCPLYKAERIKQSGSTEADILLVSDWPTDSLRFKVDIFSDRNNSAITMALKKIEQLYKSTAGGVARFGKIKIAKAYAVQCVSEDKPKKDAVTPCQTLLESDLLIHTPKVIVTFGAFATQAVLKENVKFDAVRGSFIQRHVGVNHRTSYAVLPTFSPKAVQVKSGLFNELLRDLINAFRYAEGYADAEVYTEDFLRSSYTIPTSVEEIEAVCEEAVNYAPEGTSADKNALSVDTETTCLEMYDEDAKMIAISFAWAPLKASAFLVDHPAKPWTEQERQRVINAVNKLLNSRNPKIFHHAKFDQQVLEHRYNFDINNVVWDTMCGEHLLEEDKKGEYGLKVLTKTQLPRYAGYEDKVTEIREQHGGLTRSRAAKKLRKDMERYQEALKEYEKNKRLFDKEWECYEDDLRIWEEKRKDEKERAAKARKEKAAKHLRKMNSKAYGSKPKKPKEPCKPKEPVMQEPFDFTMIPVEDLLLYAAIDADVTRQLATKQIQRITKEYERDKKMCVRFKYPEPKSFGTLMRKHVIPLNKTLADMEFTGFPVDIPYLDELDFKLQGVAKEAEQKIHSLAGYVFPIMNPAELGRIMFSDGFMQDGSKVRIPLDENIKRTAKGQIQCDEKMLRYLINTYAYEFPKQLLTYRKACKARSPFLVNVRDHARFDGRMHPSFHIVGTATGRLSSSEENMQNAPRKLAGYNIKKIFVPLEGCTLINTDAKGAEVRMFTAYAKDEKLIKAICDGLDTHSFFTSVVFGVPYESIEEARVVVDAHYGGSPVDAKTLAECESLVKKRTACKRVVFGILYGATENKISETIGISVAEARNVINLMFTMFPSIPNYINSTHREVDQFGWVSTLTGRKRRLPLASKSMFRGRSHRQAVNFKIQSTSSDIVLWVLNQVAPIIKNDLKGGLHATVHDSIVFSVKHEFVSQIPDLMHEYGTRRVAEAMPELPVPFLWDVECGSNYGEVVDIKQYLKGKQRHGTREEDVIEDEEVKTEINAYFEENEPDTGHEQAVA